MSGKRQKLPAKRSRPSEDPTPTFDASRFLNASAADRFSTICKNRSFIKEKGFITPMISLGRRSKERGGVPCANPLALRR